MIPIKNVYWNNPRLKEDIDNRVLNIMERNDIENTPFNRYKALAIINKITKDHPHPDPFINNMLRAIIEDMLVDYAFEVFEKG